MSEIRPFRAGDGNALRDLFDRVGEGAPTASIWHHEASEADVYLSPYMELEPASLLVAVQDGQLVGYLTGCRDSSRFPSESDRMRAAIARHRLLLRPGPVAFFARAMADMAVCTMRRLPTAADFRDPRWPAHLHINVLPHVRPLLVPGLRYRGRHVQQLTMVWTGAAPVVT